jgi:hypothetical protein
MPTRLTDIVATGISPCLYKHGTGLELVGQAVKVDLAGFRDLGALVAFFGQPTLQ